MVSLTFSLDALVISCMRLRSTAVIVRYLQVWCEFGCRSLGTTCSHDMSDHNRHTWRLARTHISFRTKPSATVRRSVPTLGGMYGCDGDADNLHMNTTTSEINDVSAGLRGVSKGAHPNVGDCVRSRNLNLAACRLRRRKM